MRFFSAPNGNVAHYISHNVVRLGSGSYIRHLGMYTYLGTPSYGTGRDPRAPAAISKNFMHLNWVLLINPISESGRNWVPHASWHDLIIDNDWGGDVVKNA